LDQGLEQGASRADDYSLAIFSEILFRCLEAVQARSVVEIGAFRGEFTKELLAWGRGSGARITAIEPEPPPELLELRERQPDLELIRGTSLEALPELSPADAVIIDGDHNHYTVSRELDLIAERAPGDSLPLIAFHDVCWPHGRRDSYYAPQRIPDEHRQPLARDVLLAPGEPGAARAGIFFPCAAREEGGPGNGVLTAIEDFMEARESLRLAIVPVFFGLGLLWREDAPWAPELADLVSPWDRNPLLERLEADRLEHIVDRYDLDRQRELLRSLLDSRAFAVAERLSSLRQGGRPVFSREAVSRLIGDQEPPRSRA
jgi:Methyltransferase domain